VNVTAKVGLVERYRSFLPVPNNADIVTLDEGSTPLVRLHTLSDQSRDIEVYAKCEGLNPTGSFKDRGMTVAVTMAASEGSQAIICASTGNTSASAAAYAARGGLSAFVVIPEGKIALGKLAQAMMHGARVIQIEGNFDTGMSIVKNIADTAPVTLVNSVNPYRLHGQKTAAFEIIDALGRAPDYHFLPVGNAGNISAYWMGYNEYCDAGVVSRRPVMVGCQASGAAPFLRGHSVDEPETIATAIRIGCPQSWALANQAQKESLGWFRESLDEDILIAQKILAEREGIFCEPASAVCIAGLMDELDRQTISKGATIVCSLTGHGLKDPDTAVSQSRQPMKVSPDPAAVREVILEELD
jgi:threonine synthase